MHGYRCVQREQVVGRGVGNSVLCGTQEMLEGVVQEDLALEECGCHWLIVPVTSQLFINGAKLHVLLTWSQI